MARRRSIPAWCTLLFATAAAGATGAAPSGEPPPAQGAAHADRPPVLVLTHAGESWVRRRDIARLGLPQPDAPERAHHGERFVPLRTVPQLRLDLARSRLVLFRQRTDAAPPPAPAPADDEHLIVDVYVNGDRLPDPQVVRHTPDGVLLEAGTAHALRLRPPQGGDAEAGWIPLASLVGDDYRLAPEEAILSIAAAPERFQRTVLHARPPAGAPARRRHDMPPVATLSYDLGHAWEGTGARHARGWFDAGLAWLGVHCRSRHLASRGERPLRASSHCATDWPERPATLTLGDAISDGGPLTAPLRYAGIRLGSNFALQPEVPTYPMLMFEGSVDEASQLELWFRNQLALRARLPPGGFVVDGLAPTGGRGVLHALMSTADGVHALDTPFYFDTRLLRPGLADWSIDAGWLRRDFGGEDDRYADPFARLAWRRGLTPEVTVGLESEWSEGHALLGAGTRFKVGTLGIVDLDTAAARSDAGTAWAHGAAYTFRAERWNLGLHHVRRGDGFVPLAHAQALAGPLWPLRPALPQEETRAQAGARLGRLSASLGLLSTRQAGRDRQRYATLGLNLSLPGSFLGLTAFRALDGGEDVAMLTYTLPLSSRHTLSAWTGRPAGGGGVTLQRSPGGGLGYGYRVGYRDVGGRGEAALGLDYLAEPVRTSLQVRHSASGWAGALGAAGTVVASGDGLFLHADRSDGYALVALPDAGVRIYRDRHLIAVTDRNGRALVPGLRPYQRNRIDLDLDDLALTTALGREWEEVVPQRGEIVRVDFAARSERPLDVRLAGPGGAPLPLGATVVALPGGETAYVGYDGVVFFEDAGAIERIEAHWHGGACVATVGRAAAVPPASTLTCRSEHAR
ncbi:fimbria/pilus outer membrane usher protein [Coralloluteibacterium thermophilus]|uniref:Fimbria/pilus outer membrane usher protein n=1 Tax=Coralloluteibacterium thermophilum TaxID=2707049 RepID=A0ABV9NF97_9GAMM